MLLMLGAYVLCKTHAISDNTDSQMLRRINAMKSPTCCRSLMPVPLSTVNPINNAIPALKAQIFGPHLNKSLNARTVLLLVLRAVLFQRRALGSSLGHPLPPGVLLRQDRHSLCPLLRPRLETQVHPWSSLVS